MENFLNILSIAGAVLFMVFFFGSCVFVHELGHFLVGKWRKLHIDAFSIGFKKIWGKKINGVEYRIGMLPFGGYVELPQIDSSSDEPKSADGKILPKAKPLDRLLTALAGPFFNIIYGLLLGCLVWYFGVPQDSPKMREIEVLTVEAASSEFKAGLREKDIIVKLNQKKFRSSWAEFAKDILLSIGEVNLTVRRDGQLHEIKYTPQVNPNAPGNLKYEKIAWPFFTAKIPIELYPDKNSAAEKAGIMRGDLLEEIDGVRFDDYDDLFEFIGLSGRKELKIKAKRNGESKIFTVPTEEVHIPGLPERYLIGITYDEKMPLSITHVSNFLPAKAAGLALFDKLERINGNEIQSIEQFREFMKSNGENPITFSVDRNGEKLIIKVIPVKMQLRTIGLTIGLKDYPNPLQQFAATLDMSYKSLRSLCVTIGNSLKFTEQTSSIQLRHMSGPAGIADTLYKAVHRSSFMTGIYFVVIICFALAIFNLLPLPVLDGGHVLIALIEIIIGRELPKVIIRILSYIFITLLISLMLYVSFYDLLRLAPESVRKKFNNIESVEGK